MSVDHGSRFFEARNLYLDGKFEECVKECLELSKIEHKNQFLVFSILCSSYLKLKMYPESLSSINSCIRLNKSYPKAYEKKVEVLLFLKGHRFYIGVVASVAFTLNENVKEKFIELGLKFNSEFGKMVVTSSDEFVNHVHCGVSKFIMKKGVYEIPNLCKGVVNFAIEDGVVLKNFEGQICMSIDDVVFENVIFHGAPKHNILVVAGNCLINNCLFDHTSYKKPDVQLKYSCISATDGNTLVRNCIFKNMKSSASLSAQKSRMTIVDCTLENVSMGFEFREGGGGLVQGCTLKGTERQGIFIWKKSSEVVVKDCVIENSKISGIDIEDLDVQIRVENTVVRNCKPSGIFVQNTRGLVTLEGCEVIGSVGHGIQVFLKAQVIINKCVASQGRKAGISVQFNGNSKVTVMNCVVTGNQEDGIQIRSSPGVKIKDCLIKNNGKDSYTGKKKSKKGMTCTYCRTSSKEKMMRCSGCHNVVYCGRDCQKRDWKRHKVDCKKIQNEYSVIVEDFYKNKIERGNGFKIFSNEFLTGEKTREKISEKAKREGKIPRTYQKNRFIVKVQTPALGEFGSQMEPEMLRTYIGPFLGGKNNGDKGAAITENRDLMLLYDRTKSIKFSFKNEKILKIATEKGVGRMGFYGQKAFFYAVFVDPEERKKLRIFYNSLAPFQDW